MLPMLPCKVLLPLVLCASLRSYLQVAQLTGASEAKGLPIYHMSSDSFTCFPGLSLLGDFCGSIVSALDIKGEMAVRHDRV